MVKVQAEDANGTALKREAYKPIQIDDPGSSIFSAVKIIAKDNQKCNII